MNLDLTKKTDLNIRIVAMDNFMARRVPNRMATIWADWNIIKTRIQELLEEKDDLPNSR